MRKQVVKSRPDCTCVHCNRFAAGSGHVIQAHRHTTWQAEYVVAGEIDVHAADLFVRVLEGGCVLLPPHKSHSFEYGLDGAEVFSVKFTSESLGEIPAVYAAEQSRELDALWETLGVILGTSPRPSSVRMKAAGRLLDALLLVITGEPDNDEPKRCEVLVDDVRKRIVESAGQQLAVSALARQLRCSEQYLRRRFKVETGIALKKYIDSYRANCIEQHLAHSDLSIKEIAFSFGFPDTQSFSKFVGKTLGASPRKLREGIRQSNNV